MENTTSLAAPYVSAGLSDVGSVRQVNEDSFVMRPDIGLWAVADGVGGHDAGDIASRYVAERLGAIKRPITARSFLSDAVEAISAANEAILSYAASTPSVQSMGTTIACLLAFEGFAACLWAGDSRVYRLRGDTLTRLTTDHSIVQEMVDRGEITDEQARTHPKSNVVTNAVGISDQLSLSRRTYELQDNDLYLLCSDGLTGVVPDAEIQSILRGGTGDIETLAKTLIDCALEQGSKDNVTVVLGARA